MTILGSSVYEPQGKSKDKASLSILRCSLDGYCQFREAGQCIESRVAILSFGCLYGRITRTDGYTLRAAGFYKKVKEFKAKRDEYGRFPKRAPTKLAKVGQFVWLPYPHIAMCESVPFRAHGGVFAIAQPFVPIDDFTAQAIVTLTKFQPRAMMGGIIKSYQEESVPMFLFHLKQEMPELYKEAILLDEIVLRKTFSIDSLGGKATARIQDVSPQTPVTLRRQEGVWDGGQIIFTQADARGLLGIYDSDVSEVNIRLRPSDSATVVVRDEAEIARLWNDGLIIVE